jgi:hypothetical protein
MRNADCLVLSCVAVLGCSKGAPAVSDGAIDQSPIVDPRAAICPPPDAITAPVSYVQIQQIFNDNCITCHDVGGNDGGPALDLRNGVSWANLVNQPAPSPDTCGGILVVPGDSNESYLYKKLTSAAPCYGAQMPKGEFFSMPLPACVIAMVNQWITEGAPGAVTDGGGG